MRFPNGVFIIPGYDSYAEIDLIKRRFKKKLQQQTRLK